MFKICLKERIVLNDLKKKYGLFTAIAMVVGIVVGSGVFFKSEKILQATSGNLFLGLLAILLGGTIMMISVYVFSLLANKYQKINGIVDYAEATVGSTYGYLVGWFMTIIYYPSLSVTVAWISARYTSLLFGWNVYGPQTIILTAFFLIFTFALNALAPIIAGKILVSTVIIKLFPLILMSIVGPIIGLKNGVLIENFSSVSSNAPIGDSLFVALTATIFSYEGWIIATSINAELKNAKRDLPRALLIGTCIVVIIYLLYFIGLSGAVSNEEIMQNGEHAAISAFSNIFSNLGGSVLITFVIVSSLGTLNGLMIGNSRGMYSLAARNMGPLPNVFKDVDKTTGMPTNSTIFGLLACAFWLLYFYVSQLRGVRYLSRYLFDMTELPIVSVYLFYIPIFVMVILREKDLNFFNRYIAPSLAIIACCFTLFAAYFAHDNSIFSYLIVFVIVLGFGLLFKNHKNTDLKDKL